jgi:segregation and condensation protein B
VSAPQDPREAASPAGAPAGQTADADPPTEVAEVELDGGVTAEPDEPDTDADPAGVDVEPGVEPSAGPEELHDADPPTDVAPPAGSAAESPAWSPEAEPGMEPSPDSGFGAESPAEPAVTGEPADADPPSGALAEPNAAAAETDMAVEPASIPDADSSAELMTDPPTEVAPEPAESDELHDADPPTDVETPVELGEPESAGPEDLDDADPPSDVVAGPVGGAPPVEPDATDLPDAADEVPGEEIESDELPQLADDELEKALEALLLVVDTPVEEDVLATAIGTDVARVTQLLIRMAEELAEQERGFDLRRAGGGWRYYTRDKYAPYVEKMLLDGQRAKLTRAALETLAVIAYRQPVTRARVAAVRGVNCDGVIRTLLARGLVEETGTDLETGGYLYRTTELFLERLGLSSLDDLPPIAPLLPEVDSIDDV